MQWCDVHQISCVSVWKLFLFKQSKLQFFLPKDRFIRSYILQMHHHQLNTIHTWGYLWNDELVRVHMRFIHYAYVCTPHPQSCLDINGYGIKEKKLNITVGPPRSVKPLLFVIITISVAAFAWIAFSDHLSLLSFYEQNEIMTKSDKEETFSLLESQTAIFLTIKVVCCIIVHFRILLVFFVNGDVV